MCGALAGLKDCLRTEEHSGDESGRPSAQHTGSGHLTGASGAVARGLYVFALDGVYLGVYFEGLSLSFSF